MKTKKEYIEIREGKDINSEFLDAKKVKQLELYRKLLVEWNEKINLTALTDEDSIIVKHFIDCIECCKYISENKSIIDVGTGAGFPGLVIAIIMQNKVKVTLLDSLNKRTIFLKDVVDKLELKNVEIIHGRAEEYGNNNKYREKYDIAIARAVAPLNILLEYLTPYVKVDGKVLVMKSEKIEEEIVNSKKCIGILNLKQKDIHNYILELNNEKFKRNICIYSKEKTTNIKYPRQYAKIKNNPL